MILLCGGEGSAGVKTGGAFFLLVSLGGRRGGRGHRELSRAAHERAARGLPAEVAGLDGRRRSVSARSQQVMRLV